VDILLVPRVQQLRVDSESRICIRARHKRFALSERAVDSDVVCTINVAC
jgi:hypothetical protein